MQTDFHGRGEVRTENLPADEAFAFQEGSPLSTLRSLVVMALICAAGIGFKAFLLS